MLKDKTHKSISFYWKQFFTLLKRSILLCFLALLAGIIGTVIYLYVLDQQYAQKIYPHIYIGTELVSGKTTTEIKSMWEAKNAMYKNATFELLLSEPIATISGQELQPGYDATLMARQAFLVGRSGNILSDIYTKLFKDKTVITPYFRWDEDVFNSKLEAIALTIDVEPEDARFTFLNNKVEEFAPAKSGKRLNKQRAKDQLQKVFADIPYSKNSRHQIVLAVDHLSPQITTDQSNNYGIKEKIGEGYSEFVGSIPGRIHNVALAASKFNGILIPPGGIISYNDIVGDISQATGYQPAYIIMGGRTVLGDGGGVCQVSTTLFRAGLDAGLPIIDRTAHAYRVSYYEQGGYKPGLDATVFSPSVDLKMKNDTPGHILILTRIDKQKLTLHIDLYGTADGRISEISDHRIISQTPPPEPLYQDDPSLPPGVTKQIDWAAWGAKTVFTYKVKRGNETLIDQQFFSNYRSWQSVFLRGPQT